jgi:hypothetical protein
MRAFWVLSVVPLLAAAQPGDAPDPSGAMAPPVLSGIILERDTQSASGQFSVRAPDCQVYRFRFDPKTSVERESHAIDVPRLEPGDKVEVDSDPVPGVLLRYARTVHVVVAQPPPRQTPASRLRAVYGSADRISIPAGSLMFAGVVARLNADRLVLHTRSGADQTILFRKDTRFLRDGGLVDLIALQPNTLIFVRAGKDIWDHVEAYQVIWGSILGPR